MTNFYKVHKDKHLPAEKNWKSEEGQLSQTRAETGKYHSYKQQSHSFVS